MQRLIHTALLLDLALWFGSSAYFVILAANELFAGLSEDQAAAAVGVLFPPFFTLCAVLAVLGWLLYLWLGQFTASKAKAYWIGFVLLFLNALMAVVNRFFMLPHIQSIEQQMGPISQASSALKMQFGMWHGISLLLAMASVAFLLVIWVILAFNIKFTWKQGV